MISKENQHTASLTKLPEPTQLWSEGLGISAGQQASLHLLLLSTAGASPASASESCWARGDGQQGTHTALAEDGKDREAEGNSVSAAPPPPVRLPSPSPQLIAV